MINSNWHNNGLQANVLRSVRTPVIMRGKHTKHRTQNITHKSTAQASHTEIPHNQSAQRTADAAAEFGVRLSKKNKSNKEVAIYGIQ